MPYPTAKVLVLDIDGGIVESSFLAKASVNPVVSRILSLTPMLKKLALTLVETGETILETKYEITEEMDHICRDYEHVGIITDRSFEGLRYILREQLTLLQYMSFIQVRETSSHKRKKLRYGPKIWETKAIKPHEWVLDNLIEFAEAKEIGRHDVLICDYDPEFRFMAKTLGFRVYPDETIDIPAVYPTSIERRVALSF